MGTFCGDLPSFACRLDLSSDPEHILGEARFYQVTGAQAGCKLNPQAATLHLLQQFRERIFSFLLLPICGVRTGTCELCGKALESLVASGIACRRPNDNVDIQSLIREWMREAPFSHSRWSTSTLASHCLTCLSSP